MTSGDLIRALSGAARALSLGAALGVATPAAAQLPDAWVLPKGVARLSVGGVYSAYGTRFGPGGARLPLASDLTRPLTPAAFAPLRPLQQNLDRFLASTASRTGSSRTSIGPDSLSLGTPDIRLEENLVRWPFELAVGVLPRVELGVRVPLVRGERLLQRFSATGGTVGVNPAPAANAALLRRIGAEWAALGQSALLPTDSSALGRELQRRVGALTGGMLQLPRGVLADSALGALVAAAAGVAPLDSRVEPWRLGDVEVDARLLLLSTFGPAAYPADSTGVHFRGSLTVSARLPTGSEPDTLQLLPLGYELGRTGMAGTLSADLFVGRIFWLAGAARYETRQPTDVVRRLVAPDAPLGATPPPGPARLVGGDRVEIQLAPRVRLAEAISFGVEYALVAVGETTLEDPSGSPALLELGGGTVQRAGIGARFSSLPAHARGESRFPAEVELAFATTLSGPERHPAARLATVEARLFPRLWGGARAPAAPPPPPAPAPSPQR